MTDEAKEAAKSESNPYVTVTLGPWSSHPAMIARQRKWFKFFAILPMVVALLFALLVLTNYRASDFANVNDFASFGEALLRIWGKCQRAFIALVCAFFVTLGFSVTSTLLWGVSNKISNLSGDEHAGRDTMPCPPFLIVLVALFWLVPIVLPFFKTALTAIDPRLYWLCVVLSNICCFLPLALLRLWISVGEGRRDPKLYRHPYTHLCAWILYLLAAFSIVCLTDTSMINGFVEGRFTAFVNQHFPWVLRVLDVSAAKLFWLLKLVVALFCAWRGLVHFVKWRMKWVKRTVKQKAVQEQENAVKVPAEGAEELEDDELPETARLLLENLPEGISRSGKVRWRRPGRFSVDSDTSVDPAGLKYLIDIPEGSVPTEDQRAFFDRFIASYEEARTGFLENEDPRAPQKQSDILLHGCEGSGRTTVMLASALYAAIVRGQHVLYIVPSRDVARRLADRVNSRLRSVMVDCYFSAGVLCPIDVAGWLESAIGTPSGGADLSSEESCPPDILFATPEMIERCFFSSVETIDCDKRAAMRRLLLDINVFLVDDFLEYPLAVRSHLVFVLDKFRLLLATEFVVPQFVVATPPLDAQNCIDILGQRLFGFNRFNRHKNVCELKPRRLAPYLFGTLVVKRNLTLEEASRKLLEVSLEKGNGRTLLYRRGISEPEKAKLDETFKDHVKTGGLRIVSHLYELEARRTYDNIFYLSLTCGNADAALRLNMGDDGSPVFFRIKMEGEEDLAEREAMVLLPDETALSLRAFHLRSVLQFIPRLTPVEASVWSCLGIFKEHPNIKDAAFLEDTGSRVAVQWFQDELPADDRYVEGQIWPYLVLATKAAISTRGQLIDFNVLPNVYEGIWLDRRSTGRMANRLLLAKEGSVEVSRQMVSWRDARNVALGETDLAHSDELVCRRKGVDGEDADEYTAAGLPSQDEIEKNPGRLAMSVTARYRRGTEEEFLYPVKTIRWTIPTKELEVVDLNKLDNLAQFKIQTRGDSSYHVDGVLKGLLNLRGKELDYYPSRPFSYDAYMTCLVLQPKFTHLRKAKRPEDYVRKCMTGTWSTVASSGFSPALTHALTAAFRQRFSGWSFFTVAPTFYIEGREDSIGRAVVWLVEPANSGRTVGPVFKALFEESRFWAEIFDSAYEVLSECGKLWQLRIRSRLAFADEVLDEDDLAKALSILEALRPKRDDRGHIIEEDRDDESVGNEDDDVGGEEEVVKEDVSDEPQHRALEEYTPEEREFEAVVLKGLENFSETIDVTRTSFVAQNIRNPKAVTKLYLDVLWNHPEIFYVAKSVRSQYWTRADGQVCSFVIRDISYAITKGEYPLAKKRLEEEVKSALAYMSERLSVEKPLLDQIEDRRRADAEKRLERLRQALERAERQDEPQVVETPGVETTTSAPRLSDMADTAVVNALVQMARYLHDYIVEICEYDQIAAETDDRSAKARTVYAVLVRHLAVCEGYTMAYRYLLNQVGIDSEEMLSDSMNHVWNFVKIGGKWYHVDVTWDDPVVIGEKPSGVAVSHEHFLLSDAAMRSRNHTWNGEGLPSAEDSSYDEVEWPK